jgi:hypothetical protein
MTKLILPLLNKKVKLFPGPTIYLSENVLLKKLDEIDAGLLWQKRTEEIIEIPNFKKCIYIDIEGQINNQILKKLSITLRFLFNCFRYNNPICMPLAILINRDKRKRSFLLHRLDENYETTQKIEYRIRTETKRKEFVLFYKYLEKALNIDPLLQYTFDRFNTALMRFNLFDKTVDLTISAESLIESDDEISFRFGLYNAFISGMPTPEERLNAFDLLRKLYKARSKIVHGLSLKPDKIRALEQELELNWAKLVLIIRNAIIYYVMFLNEHSKQDWAEHQKKLALGIEEPFYS